ncbi:MAG TPA: DUF6691 family protein [Baekduia sp.]|nr:DUF6691 family protein [Baekduia sp.]
MKVLAGALVGVVFGVVISWSGMASPDIIRGALLFEDSYLYFMFASAVATAWAGQALLRRRADRRALLTGDRLTYGRDPVRRRHIVGSLLFGLGWGVADACPAPIAAQVGQGVGWALLTLAGTLGGVWLYLRQGTAETEPACESTAVVPPRGAVTVAGSVR